MSDKPVTEFATLNLKAGVNLTDDSPAARLFRSDIVGTLMLQDGMTNVRWGHELEDESIAILAIDWTSFSAHENFMKSPPYGPFVKKLQDIFVVGLALHHAYLPQNKTHLLTGAPVIELVTVYGAEEGCLDNVKEFESKLEADGYHGMVYGETMEGDIAKEEGGEKGKAVVMCIGWDSREKHMEFRETERFREIIPLLREKNKGANVVHVKFIS